MAGSSGFGGSGGPGESSAESSESGQEPACGNGVLDPGEVCDDGNRVDADGCNRDCIPSLSEIWTVDSGEMRCRDLTIDSDGSVFGLWRNEAEHAIVTRVDPETGATLWRDSYPPNQAAAIYGLRTRPGFLVTGRVDVSGVDGDPYFVAWAQARDPDGNLLQEFVFPEFGNGYGDIAAVVDDQDSMWWFVRSWESSGPESYDWVKIDRNGEIEWHESAPPPGRGVAPLSNGVLIALDDGLQAFDRGGQELWRNPLELYTSSAVEFGSDNRIRALTETNIVTLASDGANVGEFQHELSAADETLAFRRLVVDASENTVVHSIAAFTDDYETFESRHWIAKYAPDGEVLWTHDVEPRPSHYEDFVYGILCGPLLLPDDSLLVASRDEDSPATMSLLRLAP